MNDVTVLMPVWKGEQPDRFRAALASVTNEQTRPPAQLLLAVDGPLPAALESVVDEIERGDYGPARVVRAPRHQGLAHTLQMGLEHAGTGIIARADSDDHCRPQRLETQLRVFVDGDYDLLGTAMQEFSDAVPIGTGPRRDRPTTHAEIIRYLPRHSPFHHPTVMMRREVALAVGGYRELDHLEDYWLWERMILGGARCGNLSEVLVDYRVDADLFARRGGWRMFVSDVTLQRLLLADRVVGPAGFAVNLVRRGAYRFAPGWLRRVGYRVFIEGQATKNVNER